MRLKEMISDAFQAYNLGSHPIHMWIAPYLELVRPQRAHFFAPKSLIVMLKQFQLQPHALTMSRSIYTGSRLQRVRLLRAPSYNKQISLHQNHGQQFLKVRLLRETAQKFLLLYLFVHFKRDPLYISYLIVQFIR